MASLDRHGRPPVTPRNGLAADLLRLLLTGPVVSAALAANLLPCLGADLAARKMADDDNVITLWRILAGTPLWTLQTAAYLTATAMWPAWGLPLLAAYGVVTCGGAAAYAPWKDSFRAVANMLGSRRRQLKDLNGMVREWTDRS